MISTVLAVLGQLKRIENTLKMHFQPLHNEVKSVLGIDELSVLPMLLLPKKGKFIKCFSPNIVLHWISSLCLNEKYLVKHKINNPNASIIDTLCPM